MLANYNTYTNESKTSVSRCFFSGNGKYKCRNTTERGGPFREQGELKWHHSHE